MYRRVEKLKYVKTLTYIFQLFFSLCLQNVRQTVGHRIMPNMWRECYLLNSNIGPAPRDIFLLFLIIFLEFITFKSKIVILAFKIDKPLPVTSLKLPR